MHHSESIILAKKPIGEADLLVTFFSREGGKIKGVARHAKRSKKRFGGILETGYVLNLHYTKSSRSELVSIDQASLVAPKTHMKADLPSTASLWIAMELGARFLQDAEANGEKYELLKRFLMTIHEKRLSRGILLFFLFRWLALSGFLPDLTSGEDHGLGYDLKDESVEVLKKISMGDIKCDIKDSTFEDLLKFIFHYNKLILGKPLKLEQYLPMLAELK